MPTNEERREFARKLRENMVAQPCFASCGNDIAREVIRSGGVVFKSCLIADLIEPEPERTCRLRKYEYKDEYGRVCGYGFKCSSCGKDLPRVFIQRHWNVIYCPKCGAKVIEED